MTARRTTLLKAVAVMAESLRFYRDGDWNHDYPGGIDGGQDAKGRYLLDMGGHAEKTLRDPSVKAAIEAIDAEKIPDLVA